MPFLILPPLGLWIGSLILDLLSHVTTIGVFATDLPRLSYGLILLGIVLGLPLLAGPWLSSRRRISVGAPERLSRLAWLGYVFQILARDKHALTVSLGDILFNACEIAALLYAVWLSARRATARAAPLEYRRTALSAAGARARWRRPTGEARRSPR
ncbi:MAG: hypothetical protein ACXWPM_02405 [Bdellovibrionota bacterium]